MSLLPLNHSCNSGYIQRNKYYLVDVTGRPTRWGVWAPEQINFNQSWADEHGINSLQILTYLLSAYRVTGKMEYLEGWLVRGCWYWVVFDEHCALLVLYRPPSQTLFNGTTGGDANHYGLNVVNQKITFPADDNFSDDELAFLPYFTYLYTLKVQCLFACCICKVMSEWVVAMAVGIVAMVIMAAMQVLFLYIAAHQVVC